MWVSAQCAGRILGNASTAPFGGGVPTWGCPSHAGLGEWGVPSFRGFLKEAYSCSTIIVALFPDPLSKCVQPIPQQMPSNPGKAVESTFAWPSYTLSILNTVLGPAPSLTAFSREKIELCPQVKTKPEQEWQISVAR